MSSNRTVPRSDPTPFISSETKAAVTHALSQQQSFLDLSYSVESIYQLAASTRGPFGCAKLLHTNPNAPSISLHQSSSALTQSLSISSNNVAASILLNLIKNGMESISDGGWTILQLATGLLKKHYSASTAASTTSSSGSNLDSPIPTSILLAGHQLALKWCLDFLTVDFVQRQVKSDPLYKPDPLRPHPVLSIQMSNLPVLLALISSQLSSKQSILQLRDEEKRYLSILCLQAFLKGIHSPSLKATSAASFASNIRIQELPGGSGTIMESNIFEGIVLDIPMPIHLEIKALCGSNPPRHNSSLKRYVNLVVVLYNINLTFDQSEHFTKDFNINQINPGSQDSSSSYQSELYRMMTSLVNRWRSLGITLVAAQKVIHPYLKQKCLECGILPLERLSIRHIEAMKQVCECKEILSGISEHLVTKDVLGRLDSIEERLIGKRRFLFLASDSSTKNTTTAAVSTFLLSCPTSPQLSELSLLLPRIFKQFSNLLRSPFICAGAGAVEMAMAAEIRRKVAGRQKQKHDIYDKIRTDLSQRMQKGGPLAALDYELYSAHLSRLMKQDHLLAQACLQVSDVLEDVACFTVWKHSNRGSGGGYSSRLFQEIKDQLRSYYDAFPSPVLSLSGSSTPHSKLNSNPAVPRESVAPSSSPFSSTDAPNNDLFHRAVDSTAVNWNPSVDWRLQFEATHAVSYTTPVSSVVSTQTIVPLYESHCLYGYHSSTPLVPSVVFRLNAAADSLDSSSSVAANLDTNSPQLVLDLIYVKRAVLQIAIEAASVLLRVD